jgi:ATP-dependent RNA helicase DDX27
MELKKGENLIEHEAEIFSRPARTWFQSTKEKEKAKGISICDTERGQKMLISFQNSANSLTNPAVRLQNPSRRMGVMTRYAVVQTM